ncbi:uncharacterized protein, partial [Phyllobates terribilis]
MENFFHRHFSKSPPNESDRRTSLMASKVRRKSGAGGPSLGLLAQRRVSVQVGKKNVGSRRKSSTAPVRVNPRFVVKNVQKHTLKSENIRNVEDLFWDIWMDCKLLNQTSQQPSDQEGEDDIYTSSSDSSEEVGVDGFSRKAISRSGLQHLAPVHCPTLSVSNGPLKEPRTSLDWTENAVNGEHLWQETNVSGDLCYLGEENCQVKFS